MANAVAVPTITLVDQTTNSYLVEGTLAVSASPANYVTGGIACSFAGLYNIGTDAPPRRMWVWSQRAAGSGATTTYIYEFLPGTTPTNGLLQVFVAGGSTPSGTIGGNVTVVGGAIGEATGINPDSNAGVLSKAAATNRTIPIATYLGAAPTFTGAAGAAAALVELAASAIPAGVSGDTIAFLATFTRFVG